jgi:hypothetical protein
MTSLSSFQKLSWTAQFCLFWTRKITTLSSFLKNRDIMYDDSILRNYISIRLHSSPKTPHDTAHVLRHSRNPRSA